MNRISFLNSEKNKDEKKINIIKLLGSLKGLCAFTLKLLKDNHPIDWVRNKRDILLRKHLKNKSFTLIANNCTGGVMSHILGVRFNSPFVNLWIEPEDYIKILKDLKKYMKYDLKFIETEFNYPVALLGDCKIYFQHYKSKQEAEVKWKKRTARMDYDNLYIMFICRDGYTEKNLMDFDNLEFKNKIAFSNKNYSNISAHCFIKGFENEEDVLFLWDYQGRFSLKRYIDQFDYLNWFNSHRE